MFFFIFVCFGRGLGFGFDCHSLHLLAFTYASIVPPNRHTHFAFFFLS